MLELLIDIFSSAPKLHIQVTEILLLSFISYFGIKNVQQAVRPILFRYLNEIKKFDQFVYFNRKTMKKTLFINVENEESFSTACWGIGVMALHLIGALLCLPSVLGYNKPFFVALACHGCCLEMAWELQDTLCKVYDCFQNKPINMLILMGIHHISGEEKINMKYKDTISLNSLCHSSTSVGHSHEHLFSR